MYITPKGFVCPECGNPCTIVPCDDSFSYSGSHCTSGQGGIHYPSTYGSAMTDCCEVFVYDIEEEDNSYGDC